jgi:hypothetical protein
LENNTPGVQLEPAKEVLAGRAERALYPLAFGAGAQKSTQMPFFSQSP